jgi:hypothetical protein
MNIIDSLAHFIRGRKNHFKDSEYVISYAFTAGGVDYYQFDDVFNLPYQRGREAIHAYEELQMRCDKDYLIRHSELINDLLTKGSIGFDEIARIKAANDQLKQRLTWVIVPDLVFRLASVVFFDSSEDPKRYEIGYNQKKIEHWKKHEDVADFFLRQPVAKLIPQFEGSKSNFQSYLKAIEHLSESHLKKLSTQFSGEAELKPKD